MHPNVFACSILIIFLATFNFLETLLADDFRYSNCSQRFSCGGIGDVSYPFWGENRPDYCGLPGFELQCQDNVPKITMTQDDYRIIDLNTNRRTLTVVRDDYWGTVCPQLLFNSSINFANFNYVSELSNVTLFYDCSDLPRSVSWGSTLFTCDVNQTSIEAYPAFEDSEVQQLIGLCNTSVIVTLFNSSAEAVIAGNKDIMDAVDDGFGLQWNLNTASECNACTQSGGLCGYNGTSNQFACFCIDQPSNTTVCSSSQTGTRSSTKIKVLAIAISSSVVGAVVALIFMTCVLRRFFPDKTVIFQDKEADQIEEFIRNDGSLTTKRYSYAEVKRLTNSFAEQLGRGGYGTVYKGKLPSGQLVAVKVLSESKGNADEFVNEVASISKTSHVNVVTLVGFCYQKTKRALIYEFMPNGSLDKYICDADSSNPKDHLEWKTLYQIAVGIARGLEYLHRGCNTRILHFDIKPQNILLDDNFCPKISDFGLAKLCKREQSILSTLGARGTIGYIAPEVFCRSFGGVSHKSDVYSYGMMVLDMVGGRKNPNAKVSEDSEMYFPGWIYKQIEPGEAINLESVTSDEEEKIARKMILVGTWCIQTNPIDRPSMTKVVEMLEGSLESLQIPPKPFLSSPPTVAGQPYSMTSSSYQMTSTR